MTTTTLRASLACTVAIALVACSTDSQIASTPAATNPNFGTDPSIGTNPNVSVATVPATVSAGPAPSDTTPPVDSVAGICPMTEYPSFGAFDLASGTLRWSACSPEEAYRMVRGATDGIALVLELSDNGSAITIALDVRDGTELWRLSTSRGLGLAPGPIAGQGVAVLDTDVEGAPFVVGVDIVSGIERWRIDPGESVVGQSDDIVVVSGASGPMPSGPLPSGPVGPPGGLRGIDRATGEQRWVNDNVIVSDEYGVARGAAAVDGTTIAVPTGTTLTAVDMSTGALLWTAPQLNYPVAAGGVFVGTEPQQSGNHTLRAVDAATGQTLWSAPGNESYGALLAIGDGVVVAILGETGEFVAYDLVTGNERWRVPQTTPGQPQLITGQSLVNLWEGQLGAYSTTDGSQIWGLTQPLRSPLMSSVGTNATTVFVAVNSLPWSD